MTYTVKHARSGLTAIAAVLALSSTPLLAQELTTPPDPVETPAPAPDPLAAEPATPEPAATEITTTATEAAPAKAAPNRRATTTRTKTTTMTARRVSSETASPAPPVTATPLTEATAEGMPVPPPTGEMVDPGAMPVDETATAETTAAPADDALPIAGAAGLALLALGGIGMSVGRRRQRKEEQAHMAANREYLDSHPDTPEASTPAFARTAAVSPAMAIGPGPVRTDVPRTKLPANFDLSRFGPHVRAAYQGPTEDNPSLSMKHRLRRAAAMDQQARHHGEAPREAAQLSVRTQEKKPMWNMDNDGFMLRRAGNKSPSKPAFQH